VKVRPVNARWRAGAGHSATLLPWLAVTILIAINLVRILRHEMWRDELQTWRLVVESPGLGTLFTNLHAEGHPGLWHLLLWPFAQWTDDPLAMQLVHAAIAAGFCLLLALKAPFSLVEKALMLLSYFLLFEYWVISRNYALGVLLAFLFVWLRSAAPHRTTMAWTVLGLMTNANVFVAIVALAMAAFMLIEPAPSRRKHIPGLMIFCLLLTLAVVTMWPADSTVQDLAAANVVANYDPLRPLRLATWMISRVFVPLHSNFPEQYWDPIFNPVLRVLVLLPIVIALYAILRKDKDILGLFALALLGIGAFCYVVYSGTVRHWGIIFIVFICCLWLQRARGRAMSRLAIVLLSINAMAGVAAAIAAELRPFSQAAQTAQWIRHQGLADATWIAVPDVPASAVAGYLGRPFYYPSCACERTFIRWGDDSHTPVPTRMVPIQVARVLEERCAPEAFLLLNTEVDAEVQPYLKDFELEFARLAQFDGAEIPAENFVIYRVDGTAMPCASGNDDGRRRPLPVVESTDPSGNG
jgi:hypothetical protein